MERIAIHKDGHPSFPVEIMVQGVRQRMSAEEAKALGFRILEMVGERVENKDAVALLFAVSQACSDGTEKGQLAIGERLATNIEDFLVGKEPDTVDCQACGKAIRDEDSTVVDEIVCCVSCRLERAEWLLRAALEHALFDEEQDGYDGDLESDIRNFAEHRVEERRQGLPFDGEDRRVIADRRGGLRPLPNHVPGCVLPPQ